MFPPWSYRASVLQGDNDGAHRRERFGLMTEEDLAKLLGVTVRTLQNRPRSNLPAFVKAGRRRLYKVDSVRAYLEARLVEQ